MDTSTLTAPSRTPHRAPARASTLVQHVGFLLSRDDDGATTRPHAADPAQNTGAEPDLAGDLDDEQAELLAAVCEATRGGRQPAGIVTVARCSGLTGAQLARALPRALAAGIVGRDPARGRLLPTRHGLQLARHL